VRRRLGGGALEVASWGMSRVDTLIGFCTYGGPDEGLKILDRETCTGVNGSLGRV
jgi:hypothetical protein